MIRQHHYQDRPAEPVNDDAVIQVIGVAVGVVVISASLFLVVINYVV